MRRSVVVRLLGALHGCAVLSQALQALDLSFNAVGPEGTNALAAWLTECLPFAPPPLLTRRTNLRALGVAGTNVTWPVLLAALEQRELRVESLDVSGNALFDKAFCLLNPFVAGGHVRHLSIGGMKGDQAMVEGVCASLLLNRNLEECTIVLDDTPMDCADREAL